MPFNAPFPKVEKVSRLGRRHDPSPGRCVYRNAVSFPGYDIRGPVVGHLDSKFRVLFQWLNYPRFSRIIPRVIHN